MLDHEHPERLSVDPHEPTAGETTAGDEPWAVKKMTHEVATDDMFVQGGE